MLKVLIFSISCMIFLSGCNQKRGFQNAAPTKPQSKPQAPVLESKTSDKTITDLEKEKAEKEAADKEKLEKERIEREKAERARSSQAAPPPKPAPTAAPATLPGNATSTLETSAAASPAMVPAPPPQTKDSKSNGATNTDYSKLVILSYDETSTLMRSIVKSASIESVRTFLQVRLSNKWDGSKLDVKIEGPYSKATYKLIHNGETAIEFKDIAFSLETQTKEKRESYALIGHCGGEKCETLFVVFLSFEKGQLSDNIPAVFKFVDGRYVLAQMDDKAIAEYIGAEAKSSQKIPPQLKVQYLAEQSMEKYFVQIIESTRKRLLKDDAMYSSLLLSGVNTDIDQWVVSFRPDGLNMKLKLNFAEYTKRAPLEFAGIISEKGARLQDKKSGIFMDIYPIVNKEVYTIVLEDPQFSATYEPFKNFKKAIQVHLCQLLEDGKDIFSKCLYFGGPLVLGINASDGKLNGPVRTDKLIEKYTPAKAEDILKAYLEDKKNSGE